MIIKAEIAELKQTNWRECLVRFAAGGLITAGAGMIADAYGPKVGGLFLAFPAIFPATLTMIAKHEREKKERQGVSGHRRGIDAAGVDAFGAAMGSVGLIAFALLGWRLLPEQPPGFVLLLAAAAWFNVAVATWLIWKRRHRIRLLIAGRRRAGTLKGEMP